MPGRSSEEREAEIRRKLSVSIDKTKKLIRAMSHEQIAAHRMEIDSWTAAADGWLEGRMTVYPGLPTFATSRRFRRATSNQ